MLNVFTGLEFKIPALLGFIIFVVYLRYVRRPSFYGWLVCLLCLYIPFSNKFPFYFAYAINGLNILLVVVLLFRKQQDKKPSNDRFITAGMFWFVACILAFIVAFLRDGNPALSRGIFLLGQNCGYPLILYLVARSAKNESEAVMDSVFFGTLMFSIHLCLQGLDIGHKMRADGLLGQANISASFIAAYASVLLARFLCGHRRWRILLLFGLLICLIAILQTVSRGGLIGLIMGLLVAYACHSHSTRRLILAAVFIPLLVYMAPSILPDKLIARFEGRDMASADRPHEAEIGAKTRLNIWRDSIVMCAKNPQGVGLGRFQYHIGEYSSEAGRDAHNIYLLILAEAGIYGLIAFFWLLRQFLVRALIAIRCDDRINQTAGIALIGALSSLMITNFFSVTIRDFGVFGYLWVLAALCTRTQGASHPTPAKI